MKINLYFETLKGEKKYVSTEMRNVMGGRTYYDFVATFKRYDNKIKEDFIVVVFDDDNKIVIKENIHIHWKTNPKDLIWNYGLTICNGRYVTNINYGKKLPICINEIQKYDKKGQPMYDRYGCPITKNQYQTEQKIKQSSSIKFPKGVLHNLVRMNTLTNY